MFAFVVSLTAVVNAIGVGIEEYELFKFSDLEILRDTTVPLLLRSISISLIIAAVVAWSRRTGGRVLLLLATLWAIKDYVLWYSYSTKLIDNLGQRLLTSTLCGLVGAKWWNIVVFFLLLLIAIWDMRILFTARGKATERFV